MSIRVVFVLPSYDLGGAQRVLLTLLKNIDKQKIDPILVVFSARGALEDLVPIWVPVHDLGRPRLREALPKLFRTLRKLAPDVVFSTFGYVNIALLGMQPFLRGQPRIIIRESNTPSRSLPSLKYSSLLRIGYENFYPKAEMIICQSLLIVDEFLQDFKIPAERLKLLYNPVDVARLRNGMGRYNREPGPGHHFIAIGSLTKQKGFDQLLEMMVAMPKDTRLTIFGEGTERAILQQRCVALGLTDKVSMPGETKNPWSECAAADALLLPSRWEGMPNVALEALACGIPVISTPSAGGITDVASLCVDGAVTLAEIGYEFTEAMHNIKIRQEPSFGDSLLPGNFEIERVTEEFNRLLYIV